MAVSEAFVDALREVLEFTPELRLKRMFGGVGVFTGYMMFGLAIDDVLYLKADADSAGRFDAEDLEPFVYVAKGERSTSLGYRRAPDALWDDAETARDWSRAGIDAALRAKARKAPKRKPIEAPRLFTGPWDEEP
jgi:DNA transformation protein